MGSGPFAGRAPFPNLSGKSGPKGVGASFPNLAGDAPPRPPTGSERRRQRRTTSPRPWQATTSWVTSVPSSARKVHLGHGSAAKATIRPAPSGNTTSGA